MTSYTWTGLESDAWGDPKNWSPNGIPGAGDAVDISGATTVMTNGESVASCIGGETPAVLTGTGLTVTGDLESVILDGGTYHAGTFNGTLEVGRLSAGTVLGEVTGGSVTQSKRFGATLTNGSVTTDALISSAIVDGGTVTAKVVDSAYEAGGQVSAQSVDLNPTNYLTNGDFVTVAGGTFSDTGALSLTASTASPQPGFEVYGTGKATISGAATIANPIGVIDVGTVPNSTTPAGGALALDGGVSLTGGRLIIGSGGALTVHGTTGDNANITIQGIDSPQATFDGAVQIGESGNGSLSIVTGAVKITSTGVALEVGDGTVSNLLGQLTVTGDTLIGDRSGETAIFSVSSATLNGALTLGENGGAGNATVNGGTLQVTGATILGQAAGDTGTLTATGAGTVLSVTGDIVIGESGSGTVNVEDGAVVDAATSDVTVGDLAGSTGALSLTGSGVTMSADSMDVGGEGAGTLTVNQGASLTIAGDLEIGADGSVAGSVNLADMGSMLSVGGNLVIGSGSLTVDDNATFDLKGSLVVGDEVAASSPADVTSSLATSVIADCTLDSGAYSLDEDSIIGDDTKGKVIVTGKATVNFNGNDVTLGDQKNGNGYVIVDGDGAELDDIKSLIVGNSGAGTVLIENHGYVDASILQDGSSPSSPGTGKITVSEEGRLDATFAFVGKVASGSLTVQNDGVVDIDSKLVVGAYGHITVSSNSAIGVHAAGVALDGAVNIGTDGDVSLDCANGAYNANTVIGGGGGTRNDGTLTLERTGAIAANKGISFDRGELILDSGVTLSNKISGFGAAPHANAILLLGVVADKPIYSSGTLTLYNGKAKVETLNVVGNYTSSDFHLDSEAKGTLVIFNPSAASAASVQEQIFNSALLADSLAHHALEAIGGRGSATPELLSVGHAPGPGGF